MGQQLPIVYVRGYAMTEDEVETTFNTPYYGFNLGATQYKMAASADPRMYLFESPVVRLLKDHGYRDSFNNFVDWQNRPLAGSVRDWRGTLWVFRYYDPEASIRAEARPEIEGYATELLIFLNRIRRACGNPDGFAVNLVAHSMGGLICRCYLQNEALADTPLRNRLANQPDADQPFDWVRVAKLFTYGTPHKGISFRSGLGWAEGVRDYFGFHGADTFGPETMRRYLRLAGNEDLHTYRPLPHAPPLKRVFSLVGSNFQDYVVRSAKAAVGPGSDGLVAIENAYVKGAPRAVVHRAHSGPFGIVNSEAGFQNLTRFLFGDLRFKLFLRPGRLVRDLPGRRDRDDRLDYLLIETSVAIRGQPGYIHTRTAEHLSAITVKMTEAASGPPAPVDDRIHLFTGYFRRDLKLAGDGFARGAIDIRVEPHYRHDGWIRDSRYEGDWMMNDRLHFGIRIGADGKVVLEHRWHPRRDNARLDLTHGGADIALPGQTRRYVAGGALEVWADPWS